MTRRILFFLLPAILGFSLLTFAQPVSAASVVSAASTPATANTFAAANTPATASTPAAASTHAAASTAETAKKSDAETTPESLLSDLFDILPSAVRDEIDSDPKKLAEKTGVSYYLTFLWDCLTSLRERFVKVLSSVLGFLLIATVATRLAGGQAKAVRLLLSAAAALLLYRLSESLFSVVQQYLTDVDRFGVALLPVLAGLYAAGGNAATAVSSCGSFSVFLSLLQVISDKILFPMIRLLFAFSVISRCGGEFDLSGIAGVVRKTYTTLSVFLGMILGVALSAQHLLSSSGDTMASRTLKFAVSNMIPVVGGAVSGALGTLSASVSYIRSAAGGVSMTAVLFLTLPALTEILVLRFAFSLSGGAAALLGAKEVEKVIQDFCGIYDMLLATVALVATAFLLLLTLFAKCVTAAG